MDARRANSELLLLWQVLGLEPDRQLLEMLADIDDAAAYGALMGAAL